MTATLSSIYILDFDGTITTKDTISAVANAAISFHASKGKVLGSAWSSVVAAYGKDYGAFVEGYRPAKEKRKTLDQEVDFYRALRRIEESSFGRLGESGLFEGIAEGDWERLGQEAVMSGRVLIREGFKEFVMERKRRQESWGVVSVNFSRAFIRGVLSTVGDGSEDVMVLANQPDMDGVLRGPKSEDGEIGPIMVTSDAKLFALKSMLVPVGQNSGGDKVVYIGDSGTDIECLTAEDVTGIIISEDTNSSLLQTMKRIGTEVPHIAQYLGAKGRIVWARDFSEINDF
jgi:2-hydroxy-3-keto-5-methylthiopentenyl-1-phosphate phosphatase